MPNIKPISDLRNYTEVLNTISAGNPVFLTQNGRRRYVIIDIDEFEKAQSALKLMGELSKGEQSAKEKGWMDISDVETKIGVRHVERYDNPLFGRSE